ncbi:MAG TPA: carbohydrate kinase [Ruminiclostridium sp.]|nr:carbohydrate kinase [Ruminiclostridium sp.]
MDIKGLKEALRNSKQPIITVFGDFCLDDYLYIDEKLNQVSLETGLTAYQVIKRKVYAGAAGTIANNLRALGAEVLCVGILGEDGDGFELNRCLKKIGADTGFMVRTRRRHTCKYTKPMLCQNGLITELNRLDIRNFTKTPGRLEKRLIENLGMAAAVSDAVVVCDQFEEDDFAAVTSNIRDFLGDLALEYPHVLFYADSRGHIDKFRNCVVKCNQKELAGIYVQNSGAPESKKLLEDAEKLYAKNRRPVYITLEESGSLVFDGCPHRIPAFRAQGPVDIVGAGDAFNAGAVFALTKGAGWAEAALAGNAAAGVVITQIGTTGTACLADILKKLESL